MNRWDETWHRLIDWTSGQAKSERLSAQVLAADGFSIIEPSHPLGGKDSGRDATCKRGEEEWAVAVYFPRGQQAFAEIRKKFLADVASARASGASRVVFVTNQELRLAERKHLKDRAGLVSCEVYELERITAILDRPGMAQVRQQFLGIGDDPPPVQIAEGGKGGSAPGAGGGGGGAVGTNARGGRGGDGGNIDSIWLPELLPLLSHVGAPGAGGGGGASASPEMPLFDQSSLLTDTFEQTIALPTPVCGKGGDGGNAGPVPPARAVEQRDLDAGLRVAVLAPADCIQLRGGLISALGLGWESYNVPNLPFPAQWPVACVFAKSSRGEGSDAIGAWLVVSDPQGNEVAKEPMLLSDGGWTVLSTFAVMTFPVNVLGIWTLSVCSGYFRLASLGIDVRQA